MRQIRPAPFHGTGSTRTNPLTLRKFPCEEVEWCSIAFDGTSLNGAGIRAQSRVTFFSLRDAVEWIFKVKKTATRRAPSTGQNLKPPTQAPRT